MAAQELRTLLDWYFNRIYGRHEGQGVLPFYCDESKVGHFAVSPELLAAGHPDSVFQLFVSLSMFQARRDVLIMEQQRSCSKADAEQMLLPSKLSNAAAVSGCSQLQSLEVLLNGCDVRKEYGLVTCGNPEIFCPVRSASIWFRRFGDSGKMPMSAYFLFGKNGDLEKTLKDARGAFVDPRKRADFLVSHFSTAFRVGRKLATLFVSFLTTPALAPGLTPWFPFVDGNHLVVVDAHAGRLIDQLRRGQGSRTYEARTEWIRSQAATIDLRKYHRYLPVNSPRMIQQALYAFGSRSNRDAWGEQCQGNCPRYLCPYHR